MNAPEPGDSPPAARAFESATTMSRDIASAYIASISRIGSWVIVSALIYRYLGATAFAMLALVRGTIGLLNYITLGIAPALIHQAARAEIAAPVPADSLKDRLATLYSNALSITFRAGLIGTAASIIYGLAFPHLYRVPRPLQNDMWLVVIPIGIGTILRLVSDAPGAVLQVRNRIAFDNKLLAFADILWTALSALWIFRTPIRNDDRGPALVAVATLYALSGALVFVMRFRAAGKETGIYRPSHDEQRRGVQRALLSYGLIVMAAQLADYLYAPTDFILIDRLLSPLEIANYAPGVQIDSGLLLLVAGLSNVLLPKAALAHAGGSTRIVRQYYLRGTVVSIALLSVASLFIWLASPWLFKILFGNSMPGTREILPLMLLNTVIGGSAAVGRSILLAVGKAKPFAISALIAGVTNVACSYAFVRYLHSGLRGIIWGTIVAVVARCVIWMPWYVVRTLRQAEGNALQIEN